MKDKNATFEYENRIRGFVSVGQYISATLLAAETRDTCADKQMTDERLYETMLSVADKLGMVNPFGDSAQFAKAYEAYDVAAATLDWETLMLNSASTFRYSTVSTALFCEYAKRFTLESGTVLIAECEKFIPNLMRLVEEHPKCTFTLTVEQPANYQVIRRLFAGNTNVEVLNTSIYKYGFTSNRYDIIFSVPNFGVRSLADDENFMCRDQDAVALENLLLHTVTGGELVITMPARITYAQGKNGELRRFVQQSYKMKEISELPEGTFEGTGIKTYLLDIVNTQPGDDDIIIRRYETPKRKNRRDVATELNVEDETFVMPDELIDFGDWNINKIFSQQDEDWLKFQESSVRRMRLGDAAEVFRGKSITKKDATGSISVINISNIGEYDIDYENLDHLDEEERKISNYALKNGDVIIPARGTAIRTAVFKAQNNICIASSNIIVIRPNEKMLDSTYLKLFLDSSLGKKLVSGTQQGLAIISISYKDLSGVEIPVPPLEEQKKKSVEYIEELKEYRDAISVAEQRWQDALSRLQSF